MTRKQGKVPRSVLQRAQERLLRIDINSLAWLSNTFPADLSVERSGSPLDSKTCVHNCKSDGACRAVGCCPESEKKADWPSTHQIGPTTTIEK